MSTQRGRTTDWALPEIDLARCDRCGACIVECPDHAVEMGPDGPFIARPGDCQYCAMCEAICPLGAIHCRYEIVWGTPDGQLDTEEGNEEVDI